MKRFILWVVLAGCFAFLGEASAAERSSDLKGAWTGTYCTMHSTDGLICDRPIDLTIVEQKNNMVRGRIKVGDESLTLSGMVNAKNEIDYIDSFGTIGVLKITAKNTLQMKALNRCVVGGKAECAHIGTFKKKSE